jgi:hypothetical protein
MSFTINPFESNPGWDIMKSLYYYYGLKDYLSFWFDETFREGKIVEIEAYDFDNVQGDMVFWSKVSSGQLLKGQKLRLKNFQISSWFPRTPGQYWTYEAAQAREYAFRRHIEEVNENGIVFDVFGKTLMTQVGGIGSVNFNKDRDYVLITATASGLTDEGIPIVCRKNVWEQIEKEFDKQKLIEVDIDGTLVNIDSTNNSFFLRSGGVPKVAVLVNSLLNITIKASALKINVCPWTIFQTKNEDKPYGFTYKTHTLFVDDIKNTNKWLNNYIDSNKGKVILTDYDEDLNHFDAIFPLRDIAIGAIVDRELMEYLQRIKKAFRYN